ncbi:MMPL family transporter [Dactylosporangium siamense]|uniref:Membrane protein n=1 Tax=Dactylosporangium siamense TaxID=685454 RepID=A0A919Q1V0_9ACTN|nr:MMPL family transporter [Dactylosporangium siamense]GIG52853.1 membrane protein [Dactylosporangium siamense]
MATFLYRLGRLAFRRRWTVAGAWLLLLVLAGAGAGALGGQTSNTVTIPGTEAQRAIDQLSVSFPEANVGGAVARVVFAAPAGEKLTDPGNKAAVEQVLAGLRSAPKVIGVLDPFQADSISPDGRYGYAQASYQVPAADVTAEDQDALMAQAKPGRDAGLEVEFGGDAVAAKPQNGGAEVAGVLVAVVVLVITFGSLLAAGLPLLTAVIGVVLGLTGVGIASGFTDLNANTPILALMLGLAVGIDYALLIVSRYRHELSAGHEPIEAAGRAAGTAGSAVVVAGLTVIIALAALSVVGIPVLSAMGLAAAGTVCVAVLVALTMLPALLSFAGRRIRGGSRHTDRPGGPRAGERWAGFVTRRPVPVLLAALAVTGVLAVPAAGLRLGLPDDGMLAADTTQHKAYNLLSAGFGPGFNGPLVVVVSTGAATEPKAAVDQVGTMIKGLDDVVAVSPPQANATGDVTLLTVIPRAGATDQSTTDLVTAIRDRRGDIQQATGATVVVTGLTAVNIDFSQKLDDALLPYLLIVVGLAFVLLLMVFRSALVPIKAALGFLLSVAATFGAVVAVFQWGWMGDLLGIGRTGPTASLLPIVLIGILFGLAMDYEVFIVSRMREEFVHGAGPRETVIAGFRHSARVVTAAAIIMVSVFAGFLFSHEMLARAIGFALAFGVLIDAFIVRMTIVPALMSMLGRAAWWLPRRLDRLLPDVDIEGEQLTRRLDSNRPAQPETANPADTVQAPA